MIDQSCIELSGHPRAYVIMRVDYKTVDHGDRSIYMMLIHESGVFELQNEMKFQ